MKSSIHVENVAKAFRIKKDPLTLFRLLGRWPGRLQATDNNYYWALRDITFDIEPGERVALVGHNGAGKTTLLKVLAGLHQPDQGTVHLSGRRAYLAGLGVGLVDQLTARENIFLYGAVYGIDRDVLIEEVDEILEWANLEEFAEHELRTLSSGMRSRLAFSCIRHIDADIFLLDEVVSTGDQVFRHKYEDFFLRGFEGRTCLISSHDLAPLRRYCSRALWLGEGTILDFGEVSEVLDRYEHERLNGTEDDEHG